MRRGTFPHGAEICIPLNVIEPCAGLLSVVGATQVQTGAAPYKEAMSGHRLAQLPLATIDEEGRCLKAPIEAGAQASGFRTSAAWAE